MNELSNSSTGGGSVFTEPPPAVTAEKLSKRYGSVRACDEVDIQLFRGEIHGILGENGAGKSTLIKMLGGAHQPTEGTIELKGKEITIENPQVSQDLGIGIIYQEFNLIPHLTVRENIFLGNPKSKNGVIRKNEEHRHAQELFQKIGIEIDPEVLCCKLSTAEQQIVEIVKALSSAPNSVNSLFISSK